ncbi:MAG: VOC family protein [Imperialibacter sp.]|uniref:VOC family protein n=1 Tax=Imperialibacter sp. TaxID=2038411 RepID=UPI0032ED373A
MITRLSHTTIFVRNQDNAYDFYTNKLGFKVVDDMPMGKDTRWLTVSPPDQPNLEIVLFPITVGKMYPEETANIMLELLQKGKLANGVFECNDIYATYEELKSKGVEFLKAPTEEFYGVEAHFKDDSGNWFSLQPKSNFTPTE